MTKCSVAFASLFFVFQVFAAPKNLLRNLSTKQWRSVENDEYIVYSQMKDLKKNQQSLQYYAIALHPNNCQIALRKISQYEQYKNFIPFIKKSEYSNETRKLFFLLDHSLLPFKIFLRFKIDRIERPGDYQFKFERGFLKNLVGKIRVSKWKNRCLMQMHASWQGTDTGINNIIFEVFSSTLGKLGTAKIFRISRY